VTRCARRDAPGHHAAIACARGPSLPLGPPASPAAWDTSPQTGQENRGPWSAVPPGRSGGLAHTGGRRGGGASLSTGGWHRAHDVGVSGTTTAPSSTGITVRVCPGGPGGPPGRRPLGRRRGRCGWRWGEARDGGRDAVRAAWRTRSSNACTRAARAARRAARARISSGASRGGRSHLAEGQGGYGAMRREYVMAPRLTTLILET